jgi:hypothetical protein
LAPAGTGALSMRRALAALLLSALAACAPRGAVTDSETPGPLLPQLAARQDQVSTLVLRGAGERVLVTLRREGKEWRLGERAGARADAARIDRYLASLAQVRRIEPKTDRESMYARLGVEDVADPGATGHELQVGGTGIAARLLLGKAHALTGASYARLHGQARSWLLDADASFDPDPLAWLERRLLEVPLARVERVQVQPREGGAFALSSRGDRFRPEDAPEAAMGDSHAGDAIASALDGFAIEDTGPDGGREASRTLEYELVDGSVLAVGVWREGPRDWARLVARLDEARAEAWARQAQRPQLLVDVRAQVAEWNRRFAGRKYLLPQALATTLMLDHDQIMRGVAPLPAP